MLEIKFILHSMRLYGQPKLKKPKDLIKIGTIKFNRKCTLDIFKNNHDVWIKHKDYFSNSLNVELEEESAPLEYLCKKYLNKNKTKRFVYSDTWGDIVLKNEAWICIQNLLKIQEYEELYLPSIPYSICRQQEIIHKIEECALPHDMTRLWGNLVDFVLVGNT